jgi:D-serine deaminase-like pyridoxal phosphate-dependent protein
MTTVHLPAGSGLDAAALALLPTPSLVADLAAVERNLAVAGRQAAGTSLRPHFKAHKCTRLLRLQLGQEGCPVTGATCATAAEAAVVVAAGVTDVLVANEIVDREPLELVASLAKQATMTVAVDSVAGLAALETRAAEAGSRVGVLVDLDVGQHRCGVLPGDPLVLELARRTAASDSLELRGLMGYEGHAQHAADAATRESLASAAAAGLAAERERLIGAGLPCDVLSGGGTGTLAAHGRIGVLTEVQAGSYPLMDEQYGEVGVGFETALWCLASVISARPGHAVLNAGMKELYGEDGMPRLGLVGARLEDGLSDEHATVHLSPQTELAPGDRVLLAPRHVDPTMNLHPHLFVCNAGNVERWDVDGRIG